MENEVNRFLLQHNTNYVKCILDIIENNTKVLFENDIISIIQKPPLDSMDVLKNKLLEIAKKNDVLLNTEKADKAVDDYRSLILESFSELEMIRIKELSKIVNKYSNDYEKIDLKISKKVFLDINREIKNIFKNNVIGFYENEIVNNVNNMFTLTDDDSRSQLIVEELKKYLKKFYIKQLIESLDLKILVKDTILLNAIKEQSDRYNFTLENSRLFN